MEQDTPTQSSVLPSHADTTIQKLDVPTQPMAEVSSPPPARRTRASNVNKHPAQILYESGLMQKRRTKAQKAEDDKRLSEAKANQERATQQGLKRLALMELDAEAKMAEAQTKPEPPPRPRPRVRYSRKGKQREGGGEEDEGATAQEQVDHPVTEPTRCSTSQTVKSQQPPVVKPKEPEKAQEKVARSARATVKTQQAPPKLKRAVQDYKESLALLLPNSRRKFATGGPVKSWIADIACGKGDAGDDFDGIDDATSPPRTITMTTLVDQDSIDDIFSDTVDDAAEKLATTSGVGTNATKTIKVSTIAVDNDGEMEFGLPFTHTSVAADNHDEFDLGPPFTQRPSITANAQAIEVAVEIDSEMDQPPFTQRPSTTTKRALDDDIVPDSEPDMSEDDVMVIDVPKVQMATGKGTAGHKASHTTASTSVGVKAKDPIVPPLKKIKTASVPSEKESTTHSPTAQQPISVAQNHNEDGYIVDAIKKRHEYTNKDLLVPTDFRWSRTFISTITLWCSTQSNVWNIADEELAAALQVIFDTIYPNVKYHVTTTGSVFSITLQRLSEWRNGFGSTALTMMLNFFTSLEAETRSVAEYLRSEYRFLRDDFENLEPGGMYLSPFLLELIASTHLNNITTYAEVPGWDMAAMNAGKNGEGVIALAAAALERAITFIAEGVLEGEQENLTSTDGKPKTKLPKILNKQTGRETTAPFQFSSTNWSGDTAAYRESVQKRGSAFIRSVFSEAHALKTNVKVEPAPGTAGKLGTVNPRTYLCKSLLFVASNYHI